MIDDPGDPYFYLMRLNIGRRNDYLARSLDGRFSDYRIHAALLTREEAEAWGNRISDAFIIIPEERRPMTAVSEDEYRSEDGWVMSREQGETPVGNEIAGRWVLRDEKGNFIDCDQYRWDMEGRYNLRLG